MPTPTDSAAAVAGESEVRVRDRRCLVARRRHHLRTCSRTKGNSMPAGNPLHSPSAVPTGSTRPSTPSAPKPIAVPASNSGVTKAIHSRGRWPAPARTPSVRWNHRRSISALASKVASSEAAAKLTNAREVATISATAATGNVNYDITTQSILYYTSNASANWTVNFRGSSGTSLNTLMSTGESMTVAFLVTQGATAYYNSAVQVDGSSVTPKYQGGTAWSAGNASSTDAYVYTIVKTGSATFTVFASQTRFA